jgi:hypothetical protein
MAFDIGPTQQSLNGYGFAIRDTHGGPIVWIEFANRRDAEYAQLAIKDALKSALAVRDGQGRQW